MKHNHNSKHSVLIMAGGTGGHIFPALAVADELKRQNVEVSWLGTEYGLETKLVGERYPLFYLSVRGVRKKGMLKKLSLPFSLSYAVIQAMRVIRKQKVKVVVGFGGYAAGPGGLAARLMRVPLIIHEQNARPGMTNKTLAKFARKVLCAFPTSAFKTKSSIEVIGNPIRDEIKVLHEQKHDFYKHVLNVLVLGGSQGAKILNDAMPEFVRDLPKDACVNLWHQTGEKTYEETKEAYNSLSPDYKCELTIEPFISDMAAAYQWADIVVCRAGALTVSEVACAGVPAFFVPFAQAVDDHQYHNAQFLVQAEAAICIREQNFNAQKLMAFVRAVDMNRAELEKMSNHAKGVAKLDAVEKVVTEIKKYLSV
ncbi:MULTISPECIES: undecaprenyldiphospho-muramoylpentapeptide beta-N-acetylglucosaminyltransferase [Cysteiniphilum]|uniref:UDP-N-acetylglucosamine--N-acetylmuramyl-(pentapeptide) pyrophosphoryl-undecaprenol N-acetylglucosamine transferase n=1 Tax=Cysteiniphilum litorale TaxID=2056700 RepID=A0A8J2Z496_9GAMM|nr:MULTISPECIES: undecaprenyldiphospho-muramoylpentapeptide beta-N-acetylglucosaminyltransferase [Cysteiniphilum]GGF95629.1 UDP-N-acetylglucosamine--N-acetylmuramyl-(pentapeptide) pyrophosphoryl-undecaprenol N-acetylglucosamine transferase [Cysteiniphilum litorale]